MLDFFGDYNNHSFTEFGFSIFMLNIIIYLTLLFSIFTLFFIFDLRAFRTLNELKNFANLQFFLISIIFIILSMSGIPPLSGFTSKFIMFIFMFLKKNIFFILFFSIINFFTIYFYIQNFRFLICKSNSCYFLFKNNNVFINFNLIYLLVIFNFFNFFGIFFIEDLLIFFDSIFISSITF